MPNPPPATGLPPALPDTALCLKCGYALRDLPESRCPECGTAFDPAHPLTWKDSAAPGAWKRHVIECAQPPGHIKFEFESIQVIYDPQQVAGNGVWYIWGWHD